MRTRKDERKKESPPTVGKPETPTDPILVSIESLVECGPARTREKKSPPQRLENPRPPPTLSWSASRVWSNADPYGREKKRVPHNGWKTRDPHQPYLGQHRESGRMRTRTDERKK